VRASEADPFLLARRRLWERGLPVRIVFRGVTMRRRTILTRAALVLACGCSREASDRPVAWLVIEPADADGDAALDSVRFAPSDAVVRVVRSGTRLVVALDTRPRAAELRVEVAAACPLAVPWSELSAGATVRRTLVSWLHLRVPPEPLDLGYDAPFVIEAVAGCPAAAEGSVVWRPISGPALHDAHADATGFHFEARTAGARDVGLEPTAWGIVPVSPRTSAEVVIEAEWRPSRPSDAAVVRRRVAVAAASRSRGLPNVTLDTGLLLAGSGWSVATAPPGASERVHTRDGLTRLIPDVAGHWVLRDAAGRTLSLQAGRYDETPLDCGRSGCHVAITETAERSPMTTALRTRVDAVRSHAHTPAAGAGGDDDPACTFACHATGEPGTRDGGFTDIAREMHGVRLAGADWIALPRALRRLGGVTCLACHGPGAIPEASARWAILRADVCATCHDAPPTYGHVTAWRSTRMARSDAGTGVTSDAACASCHTTSGFLASVRAEKDTRIPPPDVGPIGIACAACHAPHDSRPQGGASADHLVRDVRLPSSFDGVSMARTTRVCVPCHAPDGASAPSASAAAIWAGRAGIDPETGAPLSAAFTHGQVERGCVGCHRAGPTGIERGAGHAFAGDRGACSRCHGDAVPDAAAIGKGVQDDATALLAKLEGMGALGASPSKSLPGRPRHAARLDLRSNRLGRAAYDVMLVLEDPASAVHNAPYARTLLEAARKVTVATAGGGPP
jgi:hypothetical protein